MFDYHLISEHLFVIVTYEHVFVPGHSDVRAAVHDVIADHGPQGAGHAGTGEGERAMTTTTMHLSGQRIRSGVASTRRRQTAGRPLVDLAPWIAPMLWMAVVALIVAGTGALALSGDGVPSGASATIAVRVSPADTLWSIAQANRLPGASTAMTVEAISRANALRGRRIQPGTVLRVPVAGVSGSAFAQADGGTAAH